MTLLNLDLFYVLCGLVLAALASLIAVVRVDTKVVFSNAALEDSLGISRRAIVGSLLSDVFSDPRALREAISGGHPKCVCRYALRRLPASGRDGILTGARDRDRR